MSCQSAPALDTPFLNCCHSVPISAANLCSSVLPICAH
ncbi:unnamed protein product, partial [Staurois parvus]